MSTSMQNPKIITLTRLFPKKETKTNHLVSLSSEKQKQQEKNPKATSEFCSYQKRGVPFRTVCNSEEIWTSIVIAPNDKWDWRRLTQASNEDDGGSHRPHFRSWENRSFWIVTSKPKATRRLNKLWTTNFLKPFGFEAGGGKSERPQNKKKFRASDFKRKAR